MDVFFRPFKPLIDLASLQVPLAIVIIMFIIMMYQNGRTDKRDDMLIEKYKLEREQAVQRVEAFYKEKFKEYSKAGAKRKKKDF